MRHRNLRLFSWYNLLTSLSFYAPVAILYFSDIAGSYALGMSIFSLATLSQALFEVPTGIFSDRIGRKNTLVWGTCASLLSVIAYAVGGSYWVAVIGC